MSNKNLVRQNIADATDDSFADYLRPHLRLGRDQQGILHHLDRRTGSVHRIDPARGRRCGRADLLARPEPPAAAVEAYLRFVATRRGWARRRKATAADVFPEAR